VPNVPRLNNTELQIRVKRGTAAQIAASNPLQVSGEPAFGTDDKQLYISDGDTYLNVVNQGISNIVCHEDAVVCHEDEVVTI